MGIADRVAAVLAVGLMGAGIAHCGGNVARKHAKEAGSYDGGGGAGGSPACAAPVACVKSAADPLSGCCEHNGAVCRMAVACCCSPSAGTACWAAQCTCVGHSWSCVGETSCMSDCMSVFDGGG